MASLPDILLAPQRKDTLVADCVQLIEDHVATRGGIRGVAMKTGVSMLKGAKPDVLQRAVSALLPDFAQALDPQYQACRKSGQDFAAALQARADGTVAALLGIADRRIQLTQIKGAKTLYSRLRGSAEDEIRQLLPRLVQIIARHAAA